jgi:pyrimidine deaminase RibD-like protein
MTHLNAYKLAAKNCLKARHKWAFHYVIVMRGSNIIATATNRDQVHAEVAALNSLWPSERRGTKIYSIRMTKTGTFAIAKPCPECARYMKESGVKTVFYTDYNGKMVKERL